MINDPLVAIEAEAGRKRIKRNRPAADFDRLISLGVGQFHRPGHALAAQIDQGEELILVIASQEAGDSGWHTI